MRHTLVFSLLLLSQVHAQTPFALGKMVDASDANPPVNNYMYAPTALYENGAYHMFVCSMGEQVSAPNIVNNTFTPGAPMVWDFIRYMTSRNGQDWTSAKIVLKPNVTFTTTSFNEHAACDPSIVVANGYYYLFYGGAYDGPNGGIFVARSQKIAGPYEKLKANNTWAIDPPDPKVIVAAGNPSADPCGAPLNNLGNCPAGNARYGVGMPSVVYHAGEFHMWYLDDTHPNPDQLTFYTRATDPAGSWTTPQPIDQDTIRPGEVKRNPTTAQWEFFYIENESQSSYTSGQSRPVMRKMTSLNGVNWTIQAFNLPIENNSHNPGLLTKRPGGGILDSQNDGYIIAYGGPEEAIDNDPSYGFNGSHWGYWDILGKAMGYTNLVGHSIASGWQWGGMGSWNRIVSGGDYDGDGLTDRAIINSFTGAWYVIPSKAETAGMPSIPWGSTLGIPFNSGMRVLVGDYDGDGKTDPGMVDTVNGLWYILSSQNGYTQGVAPFGWGAQWGGSAYKVVQGADYDGDRKTDYAMVNTSNGRWYVIGSAAGTAGIPGIPWDTQVIPGSQSSWDVVVGDFDGDGKTDPAMVNVALGKWYVLSSLNGYAQGAGLLNWGWTWGGMGTHNKLALADYDGDGRTDPAIYDKNNGNWYVLSSKLGYAQYPSIGWGASLFPGYNSNWETVFGDFDGKGRGDIVMVDKPNGRWYIRGSKNLGTIGITYITFDLP